MIAAAILCASSAVAPAPSSDGWAAFWTDNLRWAIDQSARVILKGDGEMASLVFFGLDLHTVLGTEDRDVVTLTLQPYLTRVDDLTPTPPTFDGPEDWELVWRIFNANFKLRNDGRLNVRVGHLEVPFGLEHVVDTNGTLRDFLHGPNLGVKADWGASFNGELGDFDYEVAWTRGSGNHWDDDGDPGVVSGRIGTRADADRVFGVSAFDGDVLTPGGVVERDRLGLDAQLYHRNLGFLAEVSAGKDDGTTDVRYGMLEGDWHNRDETLFSWLQLVGAARDSDHSVEARLGVRWLIRNGLSASAQYTQVLDPLTSTGGRDGALALQLRYRM